MITRRQFVALSAGGLVPAALGLSPDSASAKTKIVSRTFTAQQTMTIQPFKLRSSKLSVGGFKRGKITKVTLTLHNLSHDLLGPVSFLLVAPDGKNIIPMSDVIVNDVVNVTLTLDDSATGDIPEGPPLASGSYRPRNYNNDTPNDFNPMEVPLISGNEKLSTFNGINPNGVWTLHVYNANGSGSGQLHGGWSLAITAQVKKKKKRRAH